MSRPARSNRPRRAEWVASVLPLPGRARPIASVRQFIEFAVNMPEQDPQVGQADSSMPSSCSSDTEGSAEATIESIRSSFGPAASPAGAPASIGPPDTKTVGMFSRMVAISMPGVILSQFEMQIMASAQCALTMYSTESAISSRLGSEYSMPPWPMAMPSSTAILLNSRGIAPAARTASATTWPTSRRCTWPGTNSVKLFATAMIGLPRSSLATPVARSRARAPAMFLPCVTVRDLNAGMPKLPSNWKNLLGRSAYRRHGPCRGHVRKHLARGVVDRLHLFPGQLRQALRPAPLPQVLSEGRPAEHVDVPDRGDVPRHLRPVDGHRGADDDLGADRRGQQLAGLLRLPASVLETLLLAVRAMPELLAVAGADRHVLVPLLGVDRVDPGRADHQVVDDFPAVRDGPRVQRQVPGAPHLVELPPRPPLGARLAPAGRDVRGGARPVDRVDDAREDREGQADRPVGDDREHHADDDHDERAPAPQPDPDVRRQVPDAGAPGPVAARRGGGGRNAGVLGARRPGHGLPVPWCRRPGRLRRLRDLLVPLRSRHSHVDGRRLVVIVIVDGDFRCHHAVDDLESVVRRGCLVDQPGRAVIFCGNVVNARVRIAYGRRSRVGDRVSGTADARILPTIRGRVSVRCRSHGNLHAIVLVGPGQR